MPQGGLFWDGRADTLQEQALGPLLNPVEMANPSVAAVAAKLRRRGYVAVFAQLFGAAILDEPAQLVPEAMFAVARYQIEAPAFHPYSSKFDYWLEGKARFTPAEMRGYVLFNDPDKANCGGCHVDKPTPDGIPPVFTDGQFEALGAPRNPALAANRDPAYFDLGICGPHRDDMREQSQFCGMFMTPTLRNAATRKVFFHNGVFSSLQQVMDFYAFRDVAPQKVYRRGPDGQVAKYDDLPPRFRANVDVVDPPFDRQSGDEPAMTQQEEADIIAFLRTLTDGSPCSPWGWGFGAGRRYLEAPPPPTPSRKGRGSLLCCPSLSAPPRALQFCRQGPHLRGKSGIKSGGSGWPGSSRGAVSVGPKSLPARAAGKAPRCRYCMPFRPRSAISTPRRSR